jgi:hypothetical protein
MSFHRIQSDVYIYIYIYSSGLIMTRHSRLERLVISDIYIYLYVCMYIYIAKTLWVSESGNTILLVKNKMSTGRWDHDKTCLLRLSRTLYIYIYIYIYIENDEQEDVTRIDLTFRNCKIYTQESVASVDANNDLYSCIHDRHYCRYIVFH